MEAYSDHNAHGAGKMVTQLIMSLEQKPGDQSLVLQRLNKNIMRQITSAAPAPGLAETDHKARCPTSQRALGSVLLGELILNMIYCTKYSC